MSRRAFRLMGYVAVAYGLMYLVSLVALPTQIYLGYVIPIDTLIVAQRRFPAAREPALRCNPITRQCETCDQEQLLKNSLAFWLTNHIVIDKEFLRFDGPYLSKYYHSAYRKSRFKSLKMALGILPPNCAAPSQEAAFQTLLERRNASHVPMSPCISSMLGESESSCSDPRRFGRCAVVGSAKTLLRTRHGKDIDAHDLIFRFNQAPTYGYEKYVGSRTDVRFLHSPVTLLKGKDGIDVPPPDPLEVQLIRFSRLNPVKLPEKVSALQRLFMQREHADRESGARHPLFIVSPVLEIAAYQLFAYDLSRPNATDFPSNGLLGTVAAMSMCHSVSLYGFHSQDYHAHLEREAKLIQGTSGRYFDPPALSYDSPHNWDRETDFLQQLHTAGVIRLVP